MTLLSPQLQAFVAVIRAGTVHGAAAKLGITQTGVTQRLRSLERSLSTTLFTRSRRGMALTTEGAALARYCQAASDLEGETLSQLQRSGTQAPLRLVLAGPTSLMRSRVVPVVSQLLRRFPELSLTLRIDDSDDLVGLLRSGEAHLAVLARDRVPRELDSKLLKKERYGLVGPRAWKSRTLREIVAEERIIDFDEADPMTHSYLRKFGLLELARPDRHFVNNTEAVAEMIAAGLGYGVLTEEFAQKLRTERALVQLNGGTWLETESALAWYPRPQMPAYLSALLKTLR